MLTDAFPPNASGVILATWRLAAEAAFVGRTAELGKLRQALHATQAGSGAAVLVAGEAGGYWQDAACVEGCFTAAHLDRGVDISSLPPPLPQVLVMETVWPPW
jgi:hypothetical protein